MDMKNNMIIKYNMINKIIFIENFEMTKSHITGYVDGEKRTFTKNNITILSK